MTWTVLLLQPDYIAEDFGSDTYQVHVEAANAAAAIEKAQQNVAGAEGEPDDFYCLA